MSARRLEVVLNQLPGSSAFAQAVEPRGWNAGRWSPEAYLVADVRDVLVASQQWQTPPAPVTRPEQWAVEQERANKQAAERVRLFEEQAARRRAREEAAS